MKIGFLVFFFLLNITLCAQSNTKSLKEESFLLHGKVKNANRFELAVSHPINNRVFCLEVGVSGAFEHKIPLLGCEDIYLYLHRPITCMAFPGDSVYVEYDAKSGTYHLSGTTPERTRELQLEMLLNGDMKRCESDVETYYNDLFFQHGGQFPMSDTLLNRATEYIGTYWAIIEKFEEERGVLLHKKQFQARPLYKLAKCFVSDPVVYNKLFALCGGRDESFDGFALYGEQFNPFLHSCIREFCVEAITAWFWKSVWDVAPKDMMKVAKEVIHNPDLFETFCLNLVYREGYLQHTSLTQIAPEWLIKQVKNPYFRKELKKMVQELSLFLQPGDEAPDFTLKDCNGKEVALHDFKGKYVYLDFWNTGCMPCIKEFPFMTRLLNENLGFKDKIVVLSVCVGQNEILWKKLLEKHQLEGVCLYTPKVDDEAIAAYQVSGFPHYMLISPEGKIVSSYFLRPSSIIMHRSKETDYLEEFIHFYL